LKLSVRIDDEGLAARVKAALADAPGITLAGLDEDADATVVAPVKSRGDFVLTPREQDVLALLAEGASNREIGERLGISIHTAKFHVRRITDKLDAVGRTDAVAMALQMRIIDV
jgi:DNA-binding CsgD family transcriptional regulator